MNKPRVLWTCFAAGWFVTFLFHAPRDVLWLILPATVGLWLVVFDFLDKPDKPKAVNKPK